MNGLSMKCGHELHRVNYASNEHVGRAAPGRNSFQDRQNVQLCHIFVSPDVFIPPLCYRSMRRSAYSRMYTAE